MRGLPALTRLGVLLSLLPACGVTLDFDDLTVEQWRTDGAPAGAIHGLAGKCLDATGCNGGAGHHAQLCDCVGRSAQQRWTLANDDTLRALGRCLDLADGAVEDATKVTLADCNGASSQNWLVLNDQLVNVKARKCLDVTHGAAVSGTPLQLWTCRENNDNQQWQVLARSRPAVEALFGPNVYVFDAEQPAAALQRRLDAVFAQQEANRFGNQRYALLFKPGAYDADVNIGFYTQVAGLGQLPGAVTIRGLVHVEADWTENPVHNGTVNVLRAAENLTVEPTMSPMNWAAARGTSYRRMHLRGDLALEDDGGWSSGGFMADSRIDGKVTANSQQQWLSRNSQWREWAGGNFNLVFVADSNAPSDALPAYAVAPAQRTREKPFLYITPKGDYQVFVPALRSESVAGPTWSDDAADPGPGSSVPLERFAIIKPSDNDTAALNDALSAGKHLLITPGIYKLDEPLRITTSDTVVLGLGLPTLVPRRGTAAIAVADAADGVKLAGFIIDAGPVSSPQLVTVGEPDSHVDHAQNPTSLHDLAFRIGGAESGKADVALQINSSNVVADNLWLWRANAGPTDKTTFGWTVSTANNGLVVRGDDVTVYGLFVEHFQKQQVLWSGNGGHTYLFMSELPEDVPKQTDWMNGTMRGYPAYEVADAVTSHYALGLAAYCNYTPPTLLDHAFEASEQVEGVHLDRMVTVSLDQDCTIRHVLNDLGDIAYKPTTQVARWPKR